MKKNLHSICGKIFLATVATVILASLSGCYTLSPESSEKSNSTEEIVITTDNITEEPQNTLPNTVKPVETPSARSSSS